jgi:ribosomal protein L20A (L18A)
MEMKKYVITYKDLDPGCPDFRIVIRAFSEDHAVEKFYADGDDWDIVSIRRERDENRI